MNGQYVASIVSESIYAVMRVNRDKQSPFNIEFKRELSRNNCL